MGIAHARFRGRRGLTLVSNEDQPDQSNVSLGDEITRIQTMINTPDLRQQRSENRGRNKHVRPRNASTMILIDGSGDDARVLMGRRNKKLKFMPGAFVFPGGSVDRHDGSVKASDELSKITQKRLLSAMRGKPTPRGARALAIAAIREVAEESGLLIGKREGFNSAHEGWQDFVDQGVCPSLAGLRLFARAITPPGLSRRFDTWFFLARSKEIGFSPPAGFQPDGELEDLQWIKPQEAIVGETREITRVMLVELMRRMKNDPNFAEDHPAPYYFTASNRFRREEI